MFRVELYVEICYRIVTLVILVLYPNFL